MSRPLQRGEVLPGSLIEQYSPDGLRWGVDYDHRLKPLTEWVHNHKGLFQDRAILDLGSNAGHFPIEYVRAGARFVQAVEGRPEFGEQWARMAPEIKDFDASRVAWATADIREYKPTQGFDVISCLGLIYHMQAGVEHIARLKAMVNPVLILVECQHWKNDHEGWEGPTENRTVAIKDEKVDRLSLKGWESKLAALGGKLDRIWVEGRGFWRIDYA